MKIINKILFMLIVLNIAPVFGMQFGKEKLETLRKSIWDYAKTFYPASGQQPITQTSQPATPVSTTLPITESTKPSKLEDEDYEEPLVRKLKIKSSSAIGSPEEQRFIMQVKDWTSNDRKFATFNSIMRVSLSSPNAKFIETLLDSLNLNNFQLVTKIVRPSEDLFSIAFSPDGKYLVAGSYGGKINIWNINNVKNPILDIKVHKDSISSILFTHDGKFLISGSFDKTIKIWELSQDNSKIKEAATPFNDTEVSSLSITPDDKYLASGSSEDEIIKIWNISDKNNINQVIALNNGADASNSCVEFSPDGKYLAACSNGSREVRIWDTINKNNINPNPMITLGDFYDSAHTISWNSKGKYLATGLTDRPIEVWDVSNKNNINRNPKALIVPSKTIVWSVAWSPNDKYLASGCDDAIRIWDIRNKDNINPRPITTLTGRARSVAWSPDNKYLASCNGDIIKILGNNLPPKLMELAKNRDGVIQYLLLSSILEFRKNQEDKKNKLYTPNPQPFKITYPKLKKLFNALPDILTQGLVDKSYVVLG